MRIRSLRTPALLTSVLLLGACSLFGGQAGPVDTSPAGTTAQSLIQDMTKAMQDTQSGTMTASFKLSAEEKESGQKIALNLALDAKGDSRDEADERSAAQLTADVSGSVEGQSISGDIDVEMRMVQEDIYARLNKLTLPPEAEMYEPAIEKVLDRWYIFADALEQTKELAASQGGALESFASAFADEDTTPAQKEQLQELFNQRFADIFDKTLEDGTVSESGASTRKISVKLNRTQLSEFAQEVAKINGKPLAASDIKEMEEGLKEIDFQGALYIGVTDKYLYRVTGAFAPATGSSLLEGGTFALEVDLRMSAFNQNQDIEAPIGAETFNPQEVMGAIAPPPSPDYPTDDGTYGGWTE